MISTCGKCGGHHFELSVVSPTGSKFKKYFIQCASCGVPVGVTDYFDSSSQHDRILEQVKILRAEIDQLNFQIRSLKNK